ncbi:MAG: FAD-dependent oxidoreductase [Thaumarchaeota archaeon]|nr:FAD-dependent oxidoreductase [Nitrososphaerota archaeon]
MVALGNEFDVIVVGAGPAGSACALTLARRGANALILEKSRVPGERNMTGGVLYGAFTSHYGLINLLPDFERDAPLERKIISHEVNLLSDPNWEKGEYMVYRLSRDSVASRVGLLNLEFETGHDYSVLRRPFDQWLANKAVDAGAMLSSQTTVEELLIEGEQVVGVRTTNEELRAKLVVDCSGVTSNLVEMAGMRRRLVPRGLYQGIKEVYKVDPQAIESRFKLSRGEGRAIFYLGSFMKGVGGGAFIYTNADTLSVGIVISMDSMIRATTEHFDIIGKPLEILQSFEAHPMVRALLEGAEMVEYSAHNIPKGYKTMLRRPYTNGFLVTGDALGTFVKIGPLIDGMRRAIASGIMAAETYLQANESGSFRASNLSRYRDLLAPIYEDVNRSGRDSFFAESGFVYQFLPRIIFSTSVFSKKMKIEGGRTGVNSKDAIQEVQMRTSLLNYDEDKSYSHIVVDFDLASKSITKPWIPACPVNCYTILTPKGVFASFKDLYEYNLRVMGGEKKGAGGSLKRMAYQLTLREVSEARVRFDHVACVACGACGAIGPREMVVFNHERDGHGVRYRYG